MVILFMLIVLNFKGKGCDIYMYVFGKGIYGYYN